MTAKITLRGEWTAETVEQDSRLNELKKDIRGVWETVGKYRYIGAVTDTKVVTHKVERIKASDKKFYLDKPIVILLGGEFEKIGEEDEDIGGGTEKVGTGV